MLLNEAYLYFINEQFSKGNSNETLTYYQYNIPKFIEYCTEHNISEVTQLDESIFEDYKSYLLKNNKNTKKISLQTYVRAIKVFINWLSEKNLTEKKIGKLTLIKPEITNIIPLSDIELQIILKSFDNSYYGVRNKLIVLLMVDSGLRRGEVVSLLSDNVNMLNKTMLVYGKGNKERIVPFGEETKRQILKYNSLKEGEYEKHFFQKQNGEPITENTIKCFFQDLKRDTGIKRLYPHLLRHTFATNYILYGGDVEELRILLGHSSITMTQKYVHLATQQKILNQRYKSHIDKLICTYESVNTGKIASGYI